MLFRDASLRECARISNAAIDWIWGTGPAPIGTEVLVYY
jgi:hypothetical protein